MNIYTSEQIREWDKYTLLKDAIKPIDLMNRAAQVFVQWFSGVYKDSTVPVAIFCGTGNNGADGIAVARLLHHKFYTVRIFICGNPAAATSLFSAQTKLLPPRGDVPLLVLNDCNKAPMIQPNTIVIDALLGSGLNRKPEGNLAKAIQFINKLPNTVVSIDVPSGLFFDQHTEGPCIQADRTFAFETPKFSFFFPEVYQWVGEWSYGAIGLNPGFGQITKTPNKYITAATISRLLIFRKKFDHKGVYGRALIVAGSKGMMGAAVLAASACMRSGVGLLTLRVPDCGRDILQMAVPESMVFADPEPDFLRTIEPPGNFQAIGIGCGIGTRPETQAGFFSFIEKLEQPLVLDADALNILALNKNWLNSLKYNTILTPHLGEFERLFGKSTHDFERHTLQCNMSKKYGVIIVLKGPHTSITTPEGEAFFNSTGNPGMATAGSGDVLTGILTGLISQGYDPKAAAVLGVYLHGLAGDMAVQETAWEGLISSDIVRFLPKAWLAVKGSPER